MKTKNIYCPTCDKSVTWHVDHPFRPFCSERCKLIDLGDWASDQHSIPGEATNIEQNDNDL